MSARRRARLEHLDALVHGGAGGQLARDPPAGGRAARVHHAPARVAALEAEREVPVRSASKLHAERLEVAHRARATPRTARARRSRARRSRPAASVSGGVLLGRVVVRQRGGDPALRPVARRLGERRAAHERDARALAGRHEGGVRGRRRRPRPRRRRHVAASVGGGATRAVRYRRACRRSSATPRRSSTTPAPATRSGPTASARSRASWSSATGSAASGVEAPPAATEAAAARCTRPSYVEARARALASGAGVRPRHPDEPGLLRGGAARGGRGVRAGRRRCSRRRAHRLLVRCGRPATTPSARARWGSACSQRGGRRRGTRSTRSAPSACWCVDWDVHHGNGTNALFHDSREVLFVSIHQWPFWPGTGALDDVGEGDGEGYSINLPVPAGHRRGRRSCSLVEHVVMPVGAPVRPDLILSRPATTRTATTRSAACALDTRSYGGMASRMRALGDEVGAPVGRRARGRLRPPGARGFRDRDDGRASSGGRLSARGGAPPARGGRDRGCRPLLGALNE